MWNLAAVAALTAYSTGIAWQAQFVSYPLYRAMGADEFPAYHLAYNAAIPGVVIIPGFLGFLACAAFPWTRPAGVPRSGDHPGGDQRSRLDPEHGAVGDPIATTCWTASVRTPRPSPA